MDYALFSQTPRTEMGRTIPAKFCCQVKTKDGFGRTIQVQKGNGTTVVSTVQTQYAPCACSPLGKVSAVSQPYAPGATPVWTT